MADDLHRPCPYRSEEPVGTLYCDCSGSPQAFWCSHNDICGYAMLHENVLKRKVVKLANGTHERLATAKVPACMTCKLRPNIATDGDLPSSLVQIANFATALVKYTKAGFKNVDATTYDDRTMACLGCDKLTKDGRCTHCGCWVSEKALWASESCPEGKW